MAGTSVFVVRWGTFKMNLEVILDLKFFVLVLWSLWVVLVMSDGTQLISSV